MHRQSLSGQWSFHQTGSDEWLPASVPGGVHTDLLTLGRIPDPFVADNEKKVQWIAYTDWEYRRSFDVTPDVLKESRQILVCDGLDTLADISLNGKLLGNANNLYRQWKWDVTGLVKEKGNELVILFHGPAAYITEKQKEKPLQAAETSPADLTSVRRLAIGAGTGVPSCLPLACGRTFASRVIPLQDLMMSLSDNNMRTAM